jgi:hypothetical protein
VRIAFVCYPVLVTVVVLATGNHWFLDTVAGAALGISGWLIAVGRPSAAGVARLSADAADDVLGTTEHAPAAGGDEVADAASR